MQATLTIAASERAYSVVEYRDPQDRCLFDANRFVDVPLVVSLRDAAGAPLGGVTVRVYVEFADNTFGPTSPLALYEDRNGNGIVDADAELVSAQGDDIARVHLDPVHGSRALLLRVNLSCAYRSEIFGYVGGITASASVEVSAREVIRPESIEEALGPTGAGGRKNTREPRP